jgi:hypothetical protein
LNEIEKVNGTEFFNATEKVNGIETGNTADLPIACEGLNDSESAN